MIQLMICMISQSILTKKEEDFITLMLLALDLEAILILATCKKKFFIKIINFPKNQ